MGDLLRSLLPQSLRREPVPQSLSEYMQREYERKHAQRAQRALDGDDPTSWPTLEPEKVGALEEPAQEPQVVILCGKRVVAADGNPFAMYGGKVWYELGPVEEPDLVARGQAWYSSQVGEPALHMGVIAGWISESV